jgi:hypothetical protein
MIAGTMARDGSTRSSLLALAALLGACSGGPASATFELTWSLADGRRCADAGAVTAVVSISAGDGSLRVDDLFDGGAPAPVRLACDAGEGVHALTVTVDHPDGSTVRVEALSPAADVLYRGEAALAATPAPTLHLVLLYVGGG